MTALTRADELALFARYRAGDAKAGSRIVGSLLRFAETMAMRYAHGLRPEDLYGAAYEGLARALPKFDPSRNCRFSTCAAFWIRQSVEREAIRLRSLVVLSSGPEMVRAYHHVRRAEATLRAQGEDATTEQIATLLKLSTATVDAARGRLGGDYSLETCIHLKGTNRHPDTYLDLLRADGDPETDLDASDEQARLAEVAELALASLTPRNRDMVFRRYMADPTETLQEVADRHHVSRERVRQICDQALVRMRAAVEAAERRAA